MNLDTSTQISVLDKYEDQISKAKKSFSYGRDLFQYWNSSKITFLAMIMDKPDFYKFLVEMIELIWIISIILIILFANSNYLTIRLNFSGFLI